MNPKNSMIPFSTSNHTGFANYWQDLYRLCQTQNSWQSGNGFANSLRPYKNGDIWQSRSGILFSRRFNHTGFASFENSWQSHWQSGIVGKAIFGYSFCLLGGYCIPLLDSPSNPHSQEVCSIMQSRLAHKREKRGRGEVRFTFAYRHGGHLSGVSEGGFSKVWEIFKSYIFAFALGFPVDRWGVYWRNQVACIAAFGGGYPGRFAFLGVSL